ncbi:MlaD family protein [uncultured Porphyromonas sp.]|uniref:MlaD family protein n=1 Tax=uncultured Porphyromonas sp. TaxID=159274 RepID=UPI00263287CC|nr:MlaD family protein [uncultured Porphyromonas sp.]
MENSFNHKQKATLIGIATITTLLMFYFGFNFLKGINIFDRNKTYYATFSNLQGVDRSTSVYLNGYRVGNVRSIKFDYNHFDGNVVQLSLDAELQIPLNTVAVIRDNPLAGGSIHLITPEGATGFVASGDTLVGQSTVDFLAKLSDELLPNLNSAILSIDTLSSSVNGLVNSTELRQIMAQLDASTKAISTTTRRLDGLMAGKVPSILNSVEASAQSVQNVTGKVEAANVEQTLADVSRVVAELKAVSSQINSKEGSLGLLINDQQLYHKLDSAVVSADSLLQDIKANPKRYVRFSLF